MDTDRIMCPGVNSASKKLVKAAGAWGWRPTTLVEPNVKKSGALTYPDPLGPSRRPVVGETFTFTLPFLFISSDNNGAGGGGIAAAAAAAITTTTSTTAAVVSQRSLCTYF